MYPVWVGVGGGGGGGGGREKTKRLSFTMIVFYGQRLKTSLAMLPIIKNKLQGIIYVNNKQK